MNCQTCLLSRSSEREVLLCSLDCPKQPFSGNLAESIAAVINRSLPRSGELLYFSIFSAEREGEEFIQFAARFSRDSTMARNYGSINSATVYILRERGRPTIMPCTPREEDFLLVPDNQDTTNLSEPLIVPRQTLSMYFEPVVPDISSTVFLDRTTPRHNGFTIATHDNVPVSTTFPNGIFLWDNVFTGHTDKVTTHHDDQLVPDVINQ